MNTSIPDNLLKQQTNDLNTLNNRYNLLEDENNNLHKNIKKLEMELQERNNKEILTERKMIKEKEHYEELLASERNRLQILENTNLMLNDSIIELKNELNEVKRYNKLNSSQSSTISMNTSKFIQDIHYQQIEELKKTIDQLTLDNITLQKQLDTEKETIKNIKINETKNKEDMHILTELLVEKDKIIELYNENIYNEQAANQQKNEEIEELQEKIRYISTMSDQTQNRTPRLTDYKETGDESNVIKKIPKLTNLNTEETPNSFVFKTEKKNFFSNLFG